MTQDIFPKQWMEDTNEKIRGSACFLSIFTKNYMDDPAALIQLAICMMQDKPLLLIVPDGTPIPAKIKKAADMIEFFKTEEEMKIKVQRMLKEYMT